MIGTIALGAGVKRLSAGAGRAVSGGWAWLTGRPERLLALLLVAAIGVAVWQWNRADDLTDQLDQVHKAQAGAATAQATVNHFPVLKSRAIAEKSDDDAKSYYEAGRRAGAAYASAHRVRPAACHGSTPDLRGADRPEPGDDGPGLAPDMVALSRADFDLLTGNSLRLAKVHQDAQALIEAGIAVSLDR